MPGSGAGAIADMQIDSGTMERDSTRDFDTCVVGAGAAGITLAKELAPD